MSQSEISKDREDNFPVGIVIFSYSLALAANVLNPIWSANLFERLGIGRWIVHNQALPTANVWTREGFGESWTDPSWLFDFFVATVYQNFEGIGLLIAKYLSLSLSLLLLIFVFARLARNKLIAVFIASLVFAGSFHLGAFEQALFGLPLLAIIFLFSLRAARQRGPIGLLLGILAAGSILGAVDPRATTVLPLLAIYLFIRSLEDRSLSLFTALTSLSIVASPLISPYRGLQYLEAIRFTAEQLWFSVISQSSAANIFDYGLSVLLLLLGCFAVSARRARPLGSDIFLVLFFLILATADKSFISLSLLISGLVYAHFWGLHIEGLQFIPGVVEAFRKLGAGLAKFRIMSPGGSFLLLSIAFVNVYGLRFSPIAETIYPDDELIQAIKRTNKQTLLHDLEVGSFLIYKRSIEMDPLDHASLPLASLQFPLRMEGRLAGVDSWQKLISREDVHTIICRSTSPVAERLKIDKNWSEVVSEQETSSRWKLFSQK